MLWLQRSLFRNAVASVTDIAKVCVQNSDAVIIQVHAYIAQVAVYYINYCYSYINL